MFPVKSPLTFYKWCRLFKRGVVFVLGWLLINSCHQKKENTLAYSNAFKPIFNKVTDLYGTDHADKGILYLDSAFRHLSNPNLNDKFRVLGFHFIYWKNLKGNPRKALLYADTMLEIAKQSETQEQYIANYVEANFFMGDAYFDMQQYNDAYKHYFVGYVTGKNELNSRALSDYAYRMGMISYKMVNYPLAVKYFKESFKFSVPGDNELSNFYRQQEVLDNIGLSFKHSNQPDSAILYFDKTLRYINNNALRFPNRLNMLEVARGVVYGNKAEVLITKGSYDSAVALLKKSIAINLKKGNENQDAELAEIKLANIYFDHKQNDTLYRLLSVLRPQLDSVKNDKAEADWNRLMSGYYFRKSDFRRAIFYLQAYNRLKDQEAKKLDLLKESDVNQQIINFEKEYQINSLQTESKQQRLYLYLALLSAIMAVAIILLVYRNWRRSKKDLEMVNQLNNQISKNLEELQTGSLEKDRILRTVAHDLRNPLGGIASLTTVMDDDEYTSEQRELISLIRETSKNSLELINELLEVTNNGSTVINKELVDINTLISNSVELLRFKAAEKGQQIALELMVVPVELFISREKIWRVAGNLISNAIKFSPSKSEIRVTVTNQDSAVVISVNDPGIGIPENLQDKVFNMFTEAKRTGTSGEKSFGLGLSISKQIIESHGGSIWFESKKGMGTSFYVSLPKQQETPIGL